MTRIPARTAALVVLFAASAAALPAQRGGGRERREPELAHFTFETVVMEQEAEAQGPRVQMGVYLPKGYADAANEEKVYPWALWLHGRNENHRKFHVDGGAQILDDLRGKGEIPELVFVALSVGNPVYVDGTSGDQETLITAKLPEFLGKRYRLAGERTRRAVMGVSMGGFGALKIALRHPDLFGVVAAHSSAILPADPDKLPGNFRRQVERMLERGGLDKVFGNPIDLKKWGEHMPMALAGTMEVEKLSSLAIYFDVGSDDRYQFAPPNQALHQLLEKRGVPHEFELVEGGGHSWGSGSLQKQLQKSLRFVGKAFGHETKGEAGSEAPSGSTTDKAKSAEAKR